MQRVTSIRVVAILTLAISVTVVVPIVLAQEQVRDVTVSLGGFRFQGPDGTSGPPQAPPANILTLANRQPIRLIFKNDDDTTHQVISPLFTAVDNLSIDVLDASDLSVVSIRGGDAAEIELRPGWKARVVFTPNFRSAEEGGTLTFEVSCHRFHGAAFCHYLQGVKALITVVRQAEPPLIPTSDY